MLDKFLHTVERFRAMGAGQGTRRGGGNDRTTAMLRQGRNNAKDCRAVTASEFVPRRLVAEKTIKTVQCHCAFIALEVVNV
jgi:hypothetical protein